MTKKLLILENIRSGAFPSDAVAVGFLLGEIEKLQDRLETQKGVIAHHVEAERILNAEIEQQKRNLAWQSKEIDAQVEEIQRLRGEAEVADEQLAQLRGFAEDHKSCRGSPEPLKVETFPEEKR